MISRAGEKDISYFDQLLCYVAHHHCCFVIMCTSLLISGYVDFWNTDACEKAASLNGKNLLGRPIRIDWAE